MAPNIRERRTRRLPTAVTPLVLLVLLVAGAGAAVAATDGLSIRYDDSIRAAVSLTSDGMREIRSGARRETCGGGLPHMCGATTTGHDVLVLGDSHAEDGLNIMRATDPEPNYLVFARGGCPPFLDLDDIERNLRAEDECSSHNDEVFRRMRELAPRLDVVVLSVRHDPTRTDAVVDLVDHLRELDLAVVVLGVGPTYFEPVKDLVARHGRIDGLVPAINDHLQPWVFETDQELQRRLGRERPGVRYVRKLPFFCPDRTCRPFVPSTDTLAVYDRSHLTLEAATAFAGQLSPRHVVPRK